jgi:dihydropteroate synthase
VVTWQLPSGTLTIADRPLVMGIVNVTPDSFSDGGRFATADKAIAHGLELARQGADLLDIGGESTRPGATPVNLQEELRRVLPVVRALARKCTVPISVDTSKAEVARRCLEAGAQIVNDVTALGDADMPALVQDFGAGVILMHMQGTPATMQQAPHYDNVVGELLRFFRQCFKRCDRAGIARQCIAIDPGIGFGKTLEHNLEILARLADFRRLQRPLCLGVSRKRFISTILDRTAEDRLAGSLATVSYAIAQGAVQIARVHDVRATVEAVTVCAKIHALREKSKKTKQKQEGSGGPPIFD